MDQCDSCAYLSYDEEYEEYVCDVDMDEDELCRFLAQGKNCPFYRDGDEYKMVRHQN